jgi:hypothetical protein
MMEDLDDRLDGASTPDESSPRSATQAMLEGLEEYASERFGAFAH